MTIEMNKHSKLVYSLVILALYVLTSPMPARGQQTLTGNEKRVYDSANYSYTMIPKTGIKRLNDAWFKSDELYRETATFFDPLSRPTLSTAFRAKGNLDLVKYVFYDDQGRPTKSYLPFAASSNLGFVSDPATLQSQFYGSSVTNQNVENDAKAYSTTELEASPLGRVLSQTGEGSAWQDSSKRHTVEYRLNAANEVDILSAGGDEGTFTVKGYWPAGALSVTETTSPEGVRLTRYSDGSGRIILSDQGGDKTYYIYDDLGRIAYVLPPQVYAMRTSGGASRYVHRNTELTSREQAVEVYSVEAGSSLSLKAPFSFSAVGSGARLSITATSLLYFHYIYDNKGRVIRKYQPSREEEEYVYDQLDRPIMYRDGNLRRDGKWKYIKYDLFGRIAYWGLITSLTERGTLQDEADGLQWRQGLFEGVASDGYTFNLSYPAVTETTMMEEYVYDNYMTITPTPPANPEYPPALGSAKGLLTRVRSRVLDENSWITTYFSYDAEGRMVFTQRVNGYRGTTQRTYVEYNFAGQVTRTQFIHCDGNTAQLTLNYFYAYTPQGQVQSVEVEIPNGLTRSQIASYEYNALGEMVKKNLGKNGADYLQQVDYFYNLRGWLTRINSVDDAASADLFSQKLHYTDGLAAVEGAPRYDGLISANEWWVKGVDGSRMAYGYGYDTHGRLTNAKYASGDALNQNVDGYNESFTYDANGNIKTLQRKGKRTDENYNQIDNLTYSYSGNQLTRVSDIIGNALDPNGFKDGASPDADYAYDPNGNMTRDLNRGITAIAYNTLNLPKTVTITTPTPTQYAFTYSASGEKLRAVDQSGGTTRTLSYDGPLTFEGATLMSIATPEGRINSNGYAAYVQEYAITDNQGNVRVTFQKDGNGVALTSAAHYYPSGLRFANPLNFPGNAVNSYGFGGKEEYDSPLGWLDFHARMYDPAIGRWHVLDPLAEKYGSFSPYNYCLGNPVNFIDPNGMNVYTLTGDEAGKFLDEVKAQMRSGSVSGKYLCSYASALSGGSGGSNSQEIFINNLINQYNLDSNVKGLYKINIFNDNEVYMTTAGPIQNGAIQTIKITTGVFNCTDQCIITMLIHEFQHVYQKSVLLMADKDEREFDAFHSQFFDRPNVPRDQTLLYKCYDQALARYKQMNAGLQIKHESDLVDFTTWLDSYFGY